MKVLFFTIFLICNLLFLENLAYSQTDFLTLAKTWQFEKSSIRGTVLNPTQIEKQDYLDLRSDFSFNRVDGGTCYQGTWKYDSENKKIKLVYNHIDKVDLFSIEEVGKGNLILKVEEDWKIEMTLYLKAVKYPCSI